jgi:subtilisin family serine protease
MAQHARKPKSPKNAPAVGSSTSHVEGDRTARNGSAGAFFGAFAHLSAAVAVVLLLLASVGSASADVCVVATPGVMFGCERSGAGNPPTTATTTATHATSTSEPDSLRASSTTPTFDPTHVAVTFKPTTKRTQATAIVTKAGGSVARAIPALHAYLVRVEPADTQRALAALRASPAVETAGREPIAEILDTTPNDSAWPEQVGLRLAGFPRAWDAARGTPQTVVAVIDTGVDAAQQDLRGALVPGYDFANRDTDPGDDNGHGTAVAGIIGARADNRLGVAGICWRCQVMPIKALDASGSGDDMVIAAAVVWAVDHGADVINLSLGGPGNSPQLSDALAYAARHDVVVVAAAGNSGTTTPFYPAADTAALSVAATTDSDQRYSWSNFGSWVDVAAPGCNVASQRGGGIVRFCGTSSAAPIVAGLAALARSAFPDASAESVEGAIEQTTTGVGSMVRYGRIDAARTLATLAPAQTTQRLTGRLRPGTRALAFTLDVAEGLVNVTARFARTAQLSLSLVAQDGTTIATASGYRSVTMQQHVSSGRVRLIVSRVKARGGVPFALTATYVAKSTPR